MFSELSDEQKIKIMANHNLALMKKFDDLEKKYNELKVRKEEISTKHEKLVLENDKMRRQIIQIEERLAEQSLSGGKKKRAEAMKRFLKHKELLEEFEAYFDKLKGGN
ncbi:MAG: hypothetical protein U5M51_12675 [Emticicia sp.]|nr:hypothetical protein [Emticicia sp.]